MDIVFILVIAGLYAASHWIAWAISRLGGELVSAAYLVSGLLALGLCVYLLYAMFKPEKF